MSEDDRKSLERIIEIHELVEFRRTAGLLEREVWVRASRRFFDPGERQPCHICGKFRGIAQAHHVIPLTTQYDRGFKYPDPEHEWLCPNHHAMVHIYIQDDDRSLTAAAFRARGRTIAALNDDLTEEEFEALMALMRRSGRSPE